MKNITSCRLGGAQIPIFGSNLEGNKKEIFKAIDWAKENKVDVLTTPEGSLSGYNGSWEDNIDELNSVLKEVEDYQKQSGVALNLGTCFLDAEPSGYIKRNQIRYYDKDGKIYAVTNKTYCGQTDGNCVGSLRSLESFVLPFAELKAVGMICNDIVGEEGEKKIRRITPLTSELKKLGVDIIFHPTNGYKICENHYPDPDDDNYKNRDVFEQYHEANIRMCSLKIKSTIFVVDACTYWGWQGDEDELDKCKTSSPSGVVNSLGEYVVKVPRYGRQYFYYDI